LVLFFEVLRCVAALERKTCDINKTLAGVVQNAHRSFRATGRKRYKSIRGRFRERSAAPTSRERVSGPLPERFRALSARPGTSQERSWRPRGTPRALLGRPGRAFGHPGGVLVASRGVPESTGGAPEAPRSIFQRFWLDFSSLLARFSFDRASMFVPFCAPHALAGPIFLASLAPATPLQRASDRARKARNDKEQQRTRTRTRKSVALRVRLAFC